MTKLFDDVELVSLDTYHHPVPMCLRMRKSYPQPVANAAGATLMNGTEKSAGIENQSKFLFTCVEDVGQEDTILGYQSLFKLFNLTRLKRVDDLSMVVPIPIEESLPMQPS